MPRRMGSNLTHPLSVLFPSAGIISSWSDRQLTLQCTVVHLQLLPIYCYPEQHCSLTLSIFIFIHLSYNTAMHRRALAVIFYN